MSIGVYCLDVGQAQCIALVGPSPAGYQAALIDVGVDGLRLASWLRRIGVQRIPLVVLTHNHADHIKGLAALVQAYQRNVGAVRFVIDRPADGIGYYVPIQEWVEAGSIGSVDVVHAPEVAGTGHGRVLLEVPIAGFHLYCIYPTAFEALAVASDAPLVGGSPGDGANAASAVVRLASESRPERTILLLGGDLTFHGWSRLDEKGHDLSAETIIVPHHGSAQGMAPGFGARQLASVVQARYALISVGSGNPYGHPAPEMVRAFRESGATVLCTQITPRCRADLDALPDGSVLLPGLADASLARSGVRCAGTIVLQVDEQGIVSVLRIEEHQAAVDRLPRAPVAPLCRA